MSGIEYLNLQTYTDLMRLCRDLRKQAKRQPLEQTVMIYLMYRPEIVAFSARQKTQKSRMTQLLLDMDMTELMLRYDEPGTRLATMEECRRILVDSIEFLHDFLKGADDYNLWGRYGTCCHRLIQCCRELDHQVEAEVYCEQFHHACRQISRLWNGLVTHDEQLELFMQMYDDTVIVFSESMDPENRTRACWAKVRRERIDLWRIKQHEREKLQTMVRTYLSAASDLVRNPTPQTLKQAMVICVKGMGIINNNLNLWGMRPNLIKYWISMGYIWELRGTVEDFRKAKDCYVHAADAAKSYYKHCERTQSGTYDAEEYLQRCYSYIAQMYAKLPGEKNEKKAAKYRRLAKEEK